MTDDKQDKQDKSPGDELREGLMHFFSAARKVIKTAEPTVHRSLDDAERVIQKIGRGGEAVAAEVGREVAKLATGLADKLRAMANRDAADAPDERTPPRPPTAPPTSGGDTKLEP
jgi:hypothetical protein